MAASLESFFL